MKFNFWHLIMDSIYLEGFAQNKGGVKSQLSGFGLSQA